MGRMKPTPEASQDYKLVNATETEGVTSLYFYRKRYTNDSNDVQFMVQCRFFANNSSTFLALLSCYVYNIIIAL